MTAKYLMDSHVMYNSVVFIKTHDCTFVNHRSNLNPHNSMGGHNALLLTVDFLPVYIKKKARALFTVRKKLHFKVSAEM